MAINDIVSSSVEDGLEDYASSYIFGRMKSITDPLKKSFDSGSEFDEAMQSFINTLSMGLAIYSLQKIMNFFFVRGGKILASMFTYIIAGKVQRAIRDKLKNSKGKGLKGFKYVGLILGVDRAPERIEMMKIAQSNIDSFDNHKFHYENQNNSMQTRLDTFSGSVSGYKGSSDLKLINLFTDLTFRGAWQNTTEHKKIYERATGFKLSKTGFTWSNVYADLNKHTSFAKTANDEVQNLTQVISNLLASKGAS